MGLSVYAKGMEDTYDCGYLTFGNFRIQLAKTYNEELGELYEKWIKESLSDEELKRINEIIPHGLAIFLTHSDCDGKLTPKECRLIYEDIKDLKMDMIGHNYGFNPKEPIPTYNMLERWKGMFQHCYKHRVNMYFR